MLKLLSRTALAAVVTITASLPAMAAPFVPNVQAIQAQTSAAQTTGEGRVIQVQTDDRWIDRRARQNQRFQGGYNPWAGERYIRNDDVRRIVRPGPGVVVRDRDWRGGRDFRRDGRYGYWRGYRGYAERRPNYRYYNGFWFPAAAFALGAVVGSQAAPQAVRPGYLSPDHVAWCSNRYRTYRSADNTYVPRVGYRAECRSPYY